MIVLGAHTDYSFMRGFGTPEQWLERCKATGVRALGLADYCSTWGHLPFRDAFKDSGIKLLYGVQLPVVSFLDKDARYSLVTLIAKESTDELYAAATLAHAQTYYRPRLMWRQIAELKDCFVIVNELMLSHRKAVPDFAYIGHKHLLPDHLPNNERVVDYGPCYPAPEDHAGFELFQAISENHRIGEIINDKFHLLREGERNATFKDINEAMLANMTNIASLCSAEPPRGKLIDMGVTGDKTERLRRLAMEGANDLCLSTHDGFQLRLPREYQDRLELELQVIHDKEFEDYFFFVHDIVSWAKERMFVGPGRGSAGGSLLCFLLGITTIDPIKFGTLFERFIDVTRSDLPDIDIDFPDIRREEVFAYLKQKYGAEHFARLGSYTTLGGKSAINDTARAFGVPFEPARELGKWTEGAGQGMVISPAWVFENVEEAKPILERFPALRNATLIDGHVRGHGVHASGVVITTDPVAKYGTVDREGVISMDYRDAENIGLVKLDALGLRTLSVIQETCDLVGINPATLYDLTWDDQEVFDTIFNGDRVTGIFQFEGHATRTLMKQIRVDNFNDLAALGALSRPGPLLGGAAREWVQARNGETVVGDVLHPSLEETYGTITYQEQFMWIARDIAGFDIAQVNGMRRAVAKKDPEKLRSYRDAFIGGASAYLARKRGFAVDDAGFIACVDDASELWENICEFGSYAFNKAHAVAYGMISYMTAWLKTKHPLEFGVAMLRHSVDDDQAKQLLRELVEQGARYVEFDVEKSDATWSIVDGVLYGGFDTIRGIGLPTAKRLVDLRARKGDGFISALTDAQRERILKRETRWASLSYFKDTYGDLYNDPGKWISETTPKGIRPPILRISDIPDAKGGYGFLGRIISRKVVDDDAPDRVEKRGGQKRGKDRHFINLTVEDDTGEISGTINRFKFEQFKWLAEDDVAGKDFLFRANIIESGRRWVFFDNVVQIKGK
jgi:DNA polymerase III alpha subunit